MACWKGYQQYGMKKKGKRMVPNCVPVKKKFAGGIIPDPSSAVAMAQQASPQDYISYKQSGQTQSSVSPVEQKYEAVKTPKEEVQATKAYTGKAIRQPTETNKEFKMRHAYHTPFMKNKPKEVYQGKFIDVELDGKKYSNSSLKKYYKGLI